LESVGEVVASKISISALAIIRSLFLVKVQFVPSILERTEFEFYLLNAAITTRY